MCIWEFFICAGNISVQLCCVVLCPVQFVYAIDLGVCVCVFWGFCSHVIEDSSFLDVMMRCWTGSFQHFVGTFCVYPEESSGLL